MSSLKYLGASLKRRKEIANMISARGDNSPLFSILHATLFSMNHNESYQLIFKEVKQTKMQVEKEV